jgi:hypothetical protein
MKTEGSQLPQTASRLNSTETASLTKIGFIGSQGWSSRLLLGLLANPECFVLVHEKTPTLVEKLVASGAVAEYDLRQLAASSNILVCSTTEIEELKDSLFRHKTGVLSGMGHLHLRQPSSCAAKQTDVFFNNSTSKKCPCHHFLQVWVITLSIPASETGNGG